MVAGLAAGLAILAGCMAPPKLPEGQYFGLVTRRVPVVLEVPGQAAVPSSEWTVKLDGGHMMTLVQAEPVFRVGQRVKVVTGDGPPRMQFP